MSNKPLQSIKFPGLGDTYTIVDIENFASAYSTSSTYQVGEYVTYDGAFYVCTTAISTAETWTPAHWSQVTVGEELSDYKAEINQLSESIAPVESTTTATAAHAVGELFMVGETLMVALSAIAIGDTITTEGSTPNAAVTKLTDKLLKDVQVNGTSIVNQGVANIPIGNGLKIHASTHDIVTDYADLSVIKTSNGNFRPITPYFQDASVFYGLAKAAGSSMGQSSNPVGTYTDAAKVAIQKMLGIYEAPWELIRRDTFTNATEADYEITVDANGQPFELTDVFLMFETPVQETYSAKSGQVRLTIPQVPYAMNRVGGHKPQILCLMAYSLWQNNTVDLWNPIMQHRLMPEIPNICDTSIMVVMRFMVGMMLVEIF